ncbi:uncharacterized protein LOC111048020 isoform X2 [Nilaparvata lugens]|uniref:uncharacterized protein LOC111048020 isoform X2 n=1 Tax=Nilaparvata lugens TaxID=108931 RepID=UPI00193D6ACD|nr:uncharacterized protein LOC111048020 isoform X2 [Nilaparvata lugens]
MMSNAVMLVLLLVPSLMAFSMVTSGGNYLRDQHPMTSAGLVGGSSSSNFQYQPWQDYATAPEYVSQIQMKRASNLGSRFNLGKKFVGYNTWLDSNNLKQRRTHFNNKPGFQKGGDSYWWMKNNY